MTEFFNLIDIGESALQKRELLYEGKAKRLFLSR